VYGTEGREFESLRARRKSPAKAGFFLCVCIFGWRNVSQICPRLGVGYGPDATTVGTRLPGRARARSGLVCQIPAARRAPGPAEDRARLDRARLTCSRLLH